MSKGPRIDRRRASTSIDVGRLSKAVQRPGIDPRVWCVRGFVKAFNVDADHGPFVDVVLQTGEEETARVGALYAGVGYGLYAPLEVDDEVLLAAPMGNFNSGLVVVARLWSKSDPPPKTASDKPADLLLVAKKDATVRLQVAGSGNVAVIVEDGKVLLGAETGTKPVGRVGDDVDMGKWIHVPASGPGVVPCTLMWFGPGTPPPPPKDLSPVSGAAVQLDGAIKKGSDKTESA